MKLRNYNKPWRLNNKVEYGKPNYRIKKYAIKRRQIM
jgi:hypothetical protein